MFTGTKQNIDIWSNAVNIYYGVSTCKTFIGLPSQDLHPKTQDPPTSCHFGGHIELKIVRAPDKVRVFFLIWERTMKIVQLKLHLFYRWRMCFLVGGWVWGSHESGLSWRMFQSILLIRWGPRRGAGHIHKARGGQQVHPQLLIFQIPLSALCARCTKGVLGSSCRHWFCFLFHFIHFSCWKKITQIHLASVTKNKSMVINSPSSHHLDHWIFWCNLPDYWIENGIILYVPFYNPLCFPVLFSLFTLQALMFPPTTR